MSNTTNAGVGQSLADIALQKSGSISAWFEIAKLNNRSITSDLIPGEPIVVPDTPQQPETVAYLSKNNIVIAAAADIKPPSPAGLDNENLQYPEPTFTIE